MKEVIMQLALAFGFLGLVGATIDYTYPIIKKIICFAAEAAAEIILMPIVLPIIVISKITEKIGQKKS